MCEAWALDEKDAGEQAAGAEEAFAGANVFQALDDPGASRKDAAEQAAGVEEAATGEESAAVEEDGDTDVREGGDVAGESAAGSNANVFQALDEPGASREEKNRKREAAAEEENAKLTRREEAILEAAPRVRRATRKAPPHSFPPCPRRCGTTWTTWGCSALTTTTGWCAASRPHSTGTDLPQ